MACSIACSSEHALPASAPGTAVLQHHAAPARNGVFIDAGLTRQAAAQYHPSPAFDVQLPGSTFYAQPLYLPDGPNGRDLIIMASEQNEVFAVDASTGDVVWRRLLGAAVPLSALPCGNIDPLGITGTPVIDPASRTLFVDAMTTPDGSTKKHLAFALSTADGSIRPGWPVDLSMKVHFDNLAFDSSVQNQRGALAFLDGTVYIPFGGLFGDCGTYHGWLVAIPASNPAAPRAWATAARGGGSWAPSGVASDGASLFIATGNTFEATTWGGGEAILRFSPDLAQTDFFAPADWQALDSQDADLGGTGPVLVDLPGANPSALAIALGKNGKVYLLDRSHLGGIGGELFSATVSRSEIINAAAAYPADSGAYVVFRGSGTNCPSGAGTGLVALRIVPGSSPTATTAWCAIQNGKGSPMVTTTDGHSESVVWSIGAEGDERLRAYNGDTGNVLFTSAPLGRVRSYQTPILAGDRVFIATDGALLAFSR